MHSFDKKVKAATNEQLRKIYNGHHKPKRLPKVKQIKKHNCLNTEVKSEASLGAESTSRPTTRRNPNVTPKETLPSPRSCSVGPSSQSDEKMFKFRQRKRNSVSSPKNLVDHNCDVTAVEAMGDEKPDGSAKKVCESAESKLASPKQEETQETFLKESAEEHEYLLFLLRVTEDIIVNDFYSNSDIKQVFRFHIEANRNRLNVQKMQQHISNLCKELNIDCKEYQNIEDLDCSKHFLDCQNYLLNNEAFKKCQECSSIRTCSLYKLHPILNDNNQLAPLMECSGDNNAAISPSLLKLLDKLSLGRVTECTEPIASTTTVNSPRLSISNNFLIEETKRITDSDQPDFDTFVKQLNNDEYRAQKDANNISDETKKDAVSEKNIALESPPNEYYATLVVTSSQNLASQSKSAPTLVQNISSNNSEAYETDFEISLSSQSLIFGNSHNNLEKNKSAPHENSPSNLEKTEEEPSRDNENKNIIPLQTNALDATLEVFDEEKKENTNCDVDGAEKPTIDNNVSLSTPSSCTNLKPKPLPSIKDLKETDQLGVSPTLREDLLKSSSEGNLLPEVEHSEPNSHQDSVIKVILQGSVNDDDYVMVKGPVYIYKPLLETQPKLIVFNTEAVPRSRRNSTESIASHRTFTIDPPEQDHVDQGIQFDVSLHSIDNSMENILELTRRAYSQFNDLKLLDSDYDLMPQRDSSDNKYHHLMVDACTSISGVNITESLLLGDDYLVKNEEMKIPSPRNEMSPKNIDDYQKFQTKLLEHDYVTHSRKLVSSVSMPRLKLNEENFMKSRRILNEEMVSSGKIVENLKSSRAGEILGKCSSDLIRFDETSQDSSLRSEDEAFNAKQVSYQPI